MPSIVLVSSFNRQRCSTAEIDPGASWIDGGAHGHAWRRASWEPSSRTRSGAVMTTPGLAGFGAPAVDSHADASQRVLPDRVAPPKIPIAAPPALPRTGFLQRTSTRMLARSAEPSLVRLAPDAIHSNARSVGRALPRSTRAGRYSLCELGRVESRAGASGSLVSRALDGSSWVTKPSRRIACLRFSVREARWREASAAPGLR
jgi:hypothetical protein